MEEEEEIEVEPITGPGLMGSAPVTSVPTPASPIDLSIVEAKLTEIKNLYRGLAQANIDLSGELSKQPSVTASDVDSLCDPTMAVIYRYISENVIMSLVLSVRYIGKFLEFDFSAIKPSGLSVLSIPTEVKVAILRYISRLGMSSHYLTDSYRFYVNDDNNLIVEESNTFIEGKVKSVNHTPRRTFDPGMEL